MNDFKLKVTLSILSAVVFSLIFILLAFAVPINKEKQVLKKSPKNVLEQISHSTK